MTINTPAVPVSVVILTRDEEASLGACLESCRWCDDVHVLDSGSTDRTLDIARDAGVQVHTNPFESFAQQRNWAIDHIPCRHAWHFHLDADERFTPALVAEIRDRIAKDGVSVAAYFVPSKMMFKDRWLRRSASYPAYQVRLFRPEVCRFIDVGHGQREQCTGTIGRLREPYLHFSFIKGMPHWLAKHELYSTREALEAIEVRKQGWPTGVTKPSNWLDVSQRRRFLKRLSYFVPGRAVLLFVYNYVIRFGFLDGAPGLEYCLLMTRYERWIDRKVRSLRQTQKHAKSTPT